MKPAFVLTFRVAARFNAVITSGVNASTGEDNSLIIQCCSKVWVLLKMSLFLKDKQLVLHQIDKNYSVEIVDV